MRRSILVLSIVFLFSFLIFINIALSACASLGEPENHKTYFTAQISNYNCGSNTFNIKIFDEHGSQKKSNNINIYRSVSTITLFHNLGYGAYTVKLYNGGSLQDQKPLTVSYCGDNECPDDESCSSCSADCGKCDESYCSQDSECASNHCVHNACRESDPYCGDNYCDNGEDCSTCQTDCGCEDGEECIDGECGTSEGSFCYSNSDCASGFCVHRACRSSDPYCGDDYCDSGECSSCEDDCSLRDCRWNGRCDIEIGEDCDSSNDCRCEKNEKCSPGGSGADERGCIKLCGNGRIDSGEDCNNCPEDFNCGSKGLQCAPHGQCEECVTTAHCMGKESFSGNYFCSGNTRMERGTRSAGICQNFHCTGSEETTREVEDCGGAFCQDGHCGCSEGYEPCKASDRCEKIGTISEGNPCKCDFQCSSNYCNPSKVCMKAMDIIFSSEMEIVKIGEQIKVTISADNVLTRDVPTKITLNLGTGAKMSGVLAGKDCSGNQCTGALTIPAKGRKEITVEIIGEGVSEIELTATVTATIGNKDYPKTEKMIVHVINCGDGKCTVGETTENCCIDCGCQPDTKYETYSCEENTCSKSFKKEVIFGIVIFIIISGVVIYIVVSAIKHLRGKHTAMMKRKRETESQKKHRIKTRRLLSRLKRKINIKNPPSVNTVAKRLKDRYAFIADKDILREEYLILLETMEAGAGEDKIRFCGHCGKKALKEDKFCGICGGKVR